MIRLGAYLRSMIGQKKLMALSGLAFSGFVLVHMLGNLLLLVGPESYNKYSHNLTSTRLIYVAEAGLLLALFIHVLLAISLSLKNKAARVERYAMPASGEKRTSLIAKTLILSGLLIFVFIVLHIKTFKYGPSYPVTYNGVEMRDLYKLVNEKFHEPGYVAWYVLAVIVLGLHLSHGFSSSFQSLGIASARNTALRRIGLAFSVLVAFGFSVQPLYLYFFGG